MSIISKVWAAVSRTVERVARRCHSRLTNRLDEEWEELSAMSDGELCNEFELLSVISHRFRRTCFCMALRFYGERKALNNQALLRQADKEKIT